MKLAGMTSALLALSPCAGGNYRPVADAPVRIGPAYTIRGATYVPAAAPAYDALGYASWYGSESGNRTANGEKFRPGWITAAHRSEEHTSELQSLMRISYAVFCLKKKKEQKTTEIKKYRENKPNQ